MIRLTALVFLGLFGLYGYFSQDILLDFWAAEEAFTARTFPQLVAVCGGVTALLLLLAPADKQLHIDWNYNWLPSLSLLVLLSIYPLILEPLGFILSTFLLLTSGAAILGERRWLPLVVVNASVVGGFWILMYFLEIQLPPGLLG